VALVGEPVLSGVCDVPGMRAQIEATARQFAMVENVDITVNGVQWELVSQ
jgi:hypothetical protein